VTLEEFAQRCRAEADQLGVPAEITDKVIQVVGVPLVAAATALRPGPWMYGGKR
jgi:hypothetical protein